MPAQALLDLRSVLLDPSENRRVVDRDAALAHHLLKVAIAHPVASVPAHCPEYDLALEVASLEVRHGSTLPPRPHPAGPRQDLQQSPFGIPRSGSLFPGFLGRSGQGCSISIDT